MYIGGWPWYISPYRAGTARRNKLHRSGTKASPTPLHEPSQPTKHDKHYLLVVTIWAFVVADGPSGCVFCCGGLRNREPRWATSCLILFRVDCGHRTLPSVLEQTTLQALRSQHRASGKGPEACIIVWAAYGSNQSHRLASLRAIELPYGVIRVVVG